jgi:serine/threonine-protein kinase HipA
MSHSSVSEIRVSLNFTDVSVPVGRLAARKYKIYFEYDAAFLSRKQEISPLHLPLQSGVQAFDRNLFEGLPGVFNDSLADGWGRLLFDRAMRLRGILPDEISPLDRLAHVGNSGMGALEYKPDLSESRAEPDLNLDNLAADAQDVLDGTADDVLQVLLSLNGSSTGARPKALIGVDAARKNIIHGAHELQTSYEPWLVKFPNATDGMDAGAIEYVYALMAIDSGLEMTPVHLFPAQRGAGFYATKRFDRTMSSNGIHRLHTHSVCGLLHSDFRTPSLDYEDLIALASVLTRDVREVEKMFRLAVFNVLAHNRDDHSKNFTFLMDETGEWTLSPAYDLTFSSGPRGEQSTMVMGEGKNPRIEHLVKLGLGARIESARINEIIEQTTHALDGWRRFAKEYNVSQVNIDLIGNRITSNA